MESCPFREGGEKFIHFERESLRLSSFYDRGREGRHFILAKRMRTTSARRKKRPIHCPELESALKTKMGLFATLWRKEGGSILRACRGSKGLTEKGKKRCHTIDGVGGRKGKGCFFPNWRWPKENSVASLNELGGKEGEASNFSGEGEVKKGTPLRLNCEEQAALFFLLGRKKRRKGKI